MADWQVQLEFTEGSSSKFWRGRVEGTALTTHWGRIGTDGQTKSKDFSTPEAARAELDKQAASKRKKGYVDAAGGSVAAEPEAPQEESWTVALTLGESGRTVEVTLRCEGRVIETTVSETYDADDSAQASFRRVKQKLIEDGYREKPS